MQKKRCGLLNRAEEETKVKQGIVVPGQLGKTGEPRRDHLSLSEHVHLRV
jgi:hypothetical protein